MTCPTARLASNDLLPSPHPGRWHSTGGCSQLLTGCTYMGGGLRVRCEQRRKNWTFRCSRGSHRVSTGCCGPEESACSCWLVQFPRKRSPPYSILTLSKRRTKIKNLKRIFPLYNYAQGPGGDPCHISCAGGMAAVYKVRKEELAILGASSVAYDNQKSDLKRLETIWRKSLALQLSIVRHFFCVIFLWCVNRGVVREINGE